MFKVLSIPDTFPFKTTARGKMPVFNPNNIADLIEANYVCMYDTWSNEEYINSKPVDDYTLLLIKGDIEETFKRYHISASRKLISSAVSSVCHRHEFDPLVDRLNAAERLWHDSGEPKNLLHMFQDYFGCEDSKFTENVTKILTYGLIGRACEPGMKYDKFIVFSRANGQYLTPFFKKLSAGFFDDSLDVSMLDMPIAIERLCMCVWLVEIEVLKQSDVKMLNEFFAKQFDAYRPKFSKMVKSVPRRFVPIGTATHVNADLSRDGSIIVLGCDPERQTKSVLDMTDEDVELILGEMVAMYRAGIDYATLSEEIGGKQRESNSSYVCHDDNFSDLETFLRMPRPADWDCSDKAVKHAHYVEYLKNPDDSNPLIEGISTNEIWCEMMGNYDQDMDIKTAKAIAKKLKALGYDNGSQRTLPGYGRVRLFTLN